MFNHQFEDENGDIQDLLLRYQNLKTGKAPSYIEEDDFEKIIAHLDEKDAIVEAIEAADIALSQFPSSALLMIKKADLLLATRKYTEALALLNTAALYDHQDMNLFILKTDAYLALDQPEEAIVLLQEALHLFEGAERTELLFELADVYDDHEAFDKVFDCLQLILEEEPTNEEALYKICFWVNKVEGQGQIKKYDVKKVFLHDAKHGLHILANKYKLTRNDEVFISTTSESNFVSSCVTCTFFNYCKVSRVLTEKTKLIAYARKNRDGNYGIGMCSGIMYLDYSQFFKKKTLKKKRELEKENREKVEQVAFNEFIDKMFYRKTFEYIYKNTNYRI